MKKILTITEIESRFPGEWILVENPQTNSNGDVSRGKVLCHSKDRDEVYSKLVALRPSKFGLLYTGEIPEDTAIIL